MKLSSLRKKNNYLLEITFSTPLYDHYLHLRKKYLRDPLGLNFSIAEIAEEQSYIHIAFMNSKNVELLGCGMMIINDTQAILRQVLIIPALQKRGFGSDFMSLLHTKLKHRWHITTVKLAARNTAVPFYEKLEYQKKGDEYIHLGIIHQDMIKKLA